MIERIHALLDLIDSVLAATSASGVLDFYVIGGAALVLHHDAPTQTKDVDIAIRPEETTLSELARSHGRNSEADRKCGVYLDAVHSAMPAIPSGYRSRAKVIEGPWKHVRIWRIDAHDLLISKLKRFHANDRRDIRWLCERTPPVIDARILESMFLDALGPPEGMETNLKRVIAFLDGDSAEL